MEKLVIVKTLEQLKELNQYIKSQDLIAFDTETDGTSKESRVIGFSVCADIELAYYVILSYWDVASQKLIELETIKGAKETLQLLVGRNLIMQNAPFDCSMVKNNFGIELMPYVHTDTLMLGHLLNENRPNGLKERGVELYGEDAKAEQDAMKASVYANGGVLTKDLYELYKADADLIAYYGAKDAILTLKIFYNDVPILYEEGLDKFFYEDETMPLLKGPTYDLNTTGLRVDPVALQNLKATLEASCLEALSFIQKEIEPHVKEKYPGTKKTNHFNINATQQLSWLVFAKLGNEFHTLTPIGKEICKALNLRMPYANSDKRAFVNACIQNKGMVWKQSYFDKKKGKEVKAKKIDDYWKYLQCGATSLTKCAKKYKWVEKFLEYKKDKKILNTYVEGIQEKLQYNIIRPSFIQNGTTSGRYSSNRPNFQNLPRDDKRVKACIVARPGKVFVGADQEQLEPRVFASISGDFTLMNCFAKGEDFYSVIGAPVYNKTECSLFKDDPNSFAKKFPGLRANSKVFGLATPYGRTAAFQAAAMGTTIDEARDLIDKYFDAYPEVEKMMLRQHELVKEHGVVHSIFGRPRRIPMGKEIKKIYGNTPHKDLPYEIRNLLNLAMNHPVQSTGASIVNRSAIMCYKLCREMESQDPSWAEVKQVLQVHDELILEGPEHLKDDMITILRHSMETAVTLPGVSLKAEPKIAYNLADLK